jgi:hypothetical protein
MPAPKPKPSAADLAHTSFDEDVQSSEPVLHRKHHADDAPGGGSGSSGSGTGSGSSSGGQQPSTDPDRPTLHKKPSTDSTGDAGSTSTSSGSSSGSNSDPDQPTLHRRDSGGSGSESSTADAQPSDPDRPVLKKSRKKQPEDVGHVESLPDETDPDRPRLKRGKSEGNGPQLIPTLMGMPADMQQAVAVSDAKSRPRAFRQGRQAKPDTNNFQSRGLPANASRLPRRNSRTTADSETVFLMAYVCVPHSNIFTVPSERTQVHFEYLRHNRRAGVDASNPNS